MSATNLDALSIDELLKIAAQRADLTGQYAYAKATAMQFRLDGSIAPALEWESKADDIYNEMTADEQW